MQWMLGGNADPCCCSQINAIFRWRWRRRSRMRAVGGERPQTSCLDPLLIFDFGAAPAFGVEGAGDDEHRPRRRRADATVDPVPRRSQRGRLAAAGVARRRRLADRAHLALGGVGPIVVAMTSWIFLMRILISIGFSEAVANATIAIRVMMFTMMPAWGMSNAAATLVGQNLGAQTARPRRGRGGRSALSPAWPTWS